MRKLHAIQVLIFFKKIIFLFMFNPEKYVVIADHSKIYVPQEDFQSGKFGFDPR